MLNIFPDSRLILELEVNPNQLAEDNMLAHYATSYFRDSKQII